PAPHLGAATPSARQAVGPHRRRAYRSRATSTANPPVHPGSASRYVPSAAPTHQACPPPPAPGRHRAPAAPTAPEASTPRSHRSRPERPYGSPTPQNPYGAAEPPRTPHGRPATAAPLRTADRSVSSYPSRAIPPPPPGTDALPHPSPRR